MPAFEKWPPLESQWLICGVDRVLIRIAIPLCGRAEDVPARKKPKPFR
ncbi:hypothetical protein ACIOTI_24800 [Streptomyces sp. NPDC087843]